MGEQTHHLLDFWLEFSSTYSYPTAMRIAPLAVEAGVRVRWRPFALAAIFKAQGWPADSPFNWQAAKGRYMWRDLERIGADLDLPFRRPDPFPQPGPLAARVALVTHSEGWGESFARAVYQAEFGKGRQIGERSVIADLITELDVSPEPVLAKAQSDTIKSQLRAETNDAQERFELLSGKDDLITYEFNTKVAKHTFCRTCGIHAFYIPRSDPDKIDVNVRCLDAVDLAAIKPWLFEGKNWETTMAKRSAT
jgi:2-hydroxychromene-2-carboxylate isomerase